MFIGWDFESGLHRIQNRVIGIHSWVCSSDDYMKCMRRAAVAYSQIDARYIHWNYRAGITIKYDDSGITLDRVLDLNQSLIVQIMGSVPKGRRRKIYGAKNDSTASTQRPIRAETPNQTRILPTTFTSDHEDRHHHPDSCDLRPSPSNDCQSTSTELRSHTSSSRTPPINS